LLRFLPMRRLIVVLLLVSSLALAAADPAGKYTGTWTGTSADGTIKIALAHAEKKGEWTADVSFTFGAEEVQCKTASVKVDGAKLDLVYDFSLTGAQLRSTVSGQIEDRKIEGKYTTTAPDGSSIDEGTFKVSREK
jgi:hypothetical protein